MRERYKRKKRKPRKVFVRTESIIILVVLIIAMTMPIASTSIFGMSFQERGFTELRILNLIVCGTLFESSDKRMIYYMLIIALSFWLSMILILIRSFNFAPKKAYVIVIFLLIVNAVSSLLFINYTANSVVGDDYTILNLIGGIGPSWGFYIIIAAIFATIWALKN